MDVATSRFPARGYVRCSLSNRGGVSATPALSHEFHREATAGTVDPVTAIPSSNRAPTQEGGKRSGPATQTLTMELSLYI